MYEKKLLQYALKEFNQLYGEDTNQQKIGVSIKHKRSDTPDGVKLIRK